MFSTLFMWKTVVPVFFYKMKRRNGVFHVITPFRHLFMRWNSETALFHIISWMNVISQFFHEKKRWNGIHSWNYMKKRRFGNFFMKKAPFWCFQLVLWKDAPKRHLFYEKILDRCFFIFLYEKMSFREFFHFVLWKNVGIIYFYIILWK